MEYTAVLDAHDIQKSFGGFTLNIPKLQIPKGFATALVGENGAGKTTLMNILAGIRLDAKGSVRYFERFDDVESAEVKERIGYTGTKNYFLPAWTGRQLKELYGLLFESFNEQRFCRLCEDLAIDGDLFKLKGKSVSKLSDGNQMKLMLAGVFARKTELLLLDEPASPLDPLMRDTLCDMLRGYLAEGGGERSVFFSTHNISDMESVTDYVIVMEEGRIVLEGFVDELKESYIAVKGDAEYADRLKDYMISFNSGKYGFEGIMPSAQLDKLAGMDVATETPSLFQLSVAVMKQSSRLKAPVFDGRE